MMSNLSLVQDTPVGRVMLMERKQQILAPVKRNFTWKCQSLKSNFDADDTDNKNETRTSCRNLREL
jgi:hypothetical protein